MMNWLRSFLTVNIGLKLLSLGLAIVIWGVVGGGTNTEILLPVPVEFRNVPPGLHYHAEPTSVQIRLRGPRWIVRQAAATDFSVPVDLATMRELGERMVYLDPRNVEGPGSIQVMDIIPPQVILNLTTMDEP